jgi:hypothetical protein
MFFTFPEDAHWNPDWQAVEFVEIGEYRGVVRAPRRVFQRHVVGFNPAFSRNRPRGLGRPSCG